MILIYYIEDNKSIKSIIKKTIQNDGLLGVGFQNGEDLLHEFHSQKPDIILLNDKLLGMSGLDILKEIRRKDRDVPVIMISALQGGIDKIIALDTGADDYITEPFGALELLSRIQSKIKKNIDDKIYQIGNVNLDDKQHSCLVNDKEIYFTNKEFSILRLLMKNKTKVVSKESIFRNVWETDFIGETRTLDMHIKSLRQKLKSKEASAEIKTIRGIGYIIE